MTRSNPLRFPADVVAALDRITQSAGGKRGALLDRRSNRRGRRDLGITDEQAWRIVAGLTIADFHEGPSVNHHEPERELWVFAPLVGVRRAYVKIAFRPSDPVDRTALVIWSIHPARFEMERPYA